jgi:four helix bundle protein
MNNFKTYELAIAFNRQSRSLRLSSALREQFDRASVSIVLNLAEGRGRSTRKDQLRFFHIAMGSVRECQAILDLAEHNSSIAWSLLDKLAASLYRLIQHARG